MPPRLLARDPTALGRKSQQILSERRIAEKKSGTASPTSSRPSPAANIGVRRHAILALDVAACFFERILLASPSGRAAPTAAARR
ncbi:MAG: hypothetical protein QM820_64395 [Minicystis sp.]